MESMIIQALVSANKPIGISRQRIKNYIIDNFYDGDMTMLDEIKDECNEVLKKGIENGTFGIRKGLTGPISLR